MARLDSRHWLVAAGDTWASIATASGTTRNEVLLANGLPTSGPPPPKVGQVVHLPLVGL